MKTVVTGIVAWAMTMFIPTATRNLTTPPTTTTTTLATIPTTPTTRTEQTVSRQRVLQATSTVPSTSPSSSGGYSQAKVSTYGIEAGSRTANGEFFDGSSITFAHKSMAFG